MTTAQKAMVGYGVVMIGMGVQAFAFPFEGHKSSLMSLIGGGGIGLIVLILGVLASKAANPRWYYISGLVFALVGASRFIGSAMKGEFSIYPGGVVLALTVALIAILGGGHMAAMKAKKAESVTE